MANILVGDEGCTYNDIIEIIENSPVNAVATEGWRSLARRMGIPQGKINKYAKDIIWDKKREIDVICEMLHEWRLHKGSSATIFAFHKILEDLRWHQLAESIKDKYITTSAAQSATGSNQATMSGQAESNFDAISERDEVYLDFERNVDVKDKVLSKMRPDIINIFVGEQSTKAVLVELATIDDVFDSMEVNELIAKRFDSERDRISDLLLLLQNKEANPIKVCLEKMCNLDALPTKSYQLRKKIHDKYPGSVKKVMPSN